MSPYQNANAHLSDHLISLYLRLQRYVARYWYRLTQASGDLNDLYVGFHEARTLFGHVSPDGPPGDSWPQIDELDTALQDHQRRMQQRLTQHAESAGEDLPVENLRAVFYLEDWQLDLVLATCAPALSVDLSRLYRFCWADFTRELPTVGFLAELLADGPVMFDQLVAAFEETSPLVTQGLVKVSASKDDRALIHRGVSAPHRLVAFFKGRMLELSPRLGRACTRLSSESAKRRKDLLVEELALEQCVSAMTRAARNRRSGRPRVVLNGPRGVGRLDVWQTLSAELGHGVLVIDLARLSKHPLELSAELSEALLFARLNGDLVFLRAEQFLDGIESDDFRWGILAAHLDPCPIPMAFAVNGQATSLHHALADTVDIRFPFSSRESQRAAWQQSLSRHSIAPDGITDRILERFNLTPGIIEKATEDAVSRKQYIQGKKTVSLTTDDLQLAVQKRLEHSLTALAEPFSTTVGWDGLVVPAEVKELLSEIVLRAEHGHQVFETWGFREKLGYGTGLTCLFDGPPGTGKTLASAIISKELGRELYRIDVSRIASKWIGETEKNLARVFDEAERAQVILLFDEADSLFAKRTDVSRSADKYANMEVNYLLQRMEAYDGVTILTTNFETAIDEAFKRRIQFRVHFPLPDIDLRERLWQSMLPSVADVDDNIDFFKLADRFELAGGSIKNAVVRAAFLAVEEGSPIGLKHLEKAAVREARAMGQLVAD